MAKQDFLVELGTEELPPKALKPLSDAFTRGITNGLEEAGIQFGKVEAFAAPRRLAVRVRYLEDAQPDKPVEKRGPAVKAAFDDSGNPTRALTGFATSLGVTPDQLDTMETDKGAWVVYRT
ncbi:MAG: glycine--tRNA ligase subunit beta, partial [Marinobacter sp.]